MFKLLGNSVYPLTMVCLEPNRSYGVPCRMDEKIEASYRFRMTEKKKSQVYKPTLWKGHVQHRSGNHTAYVIDCNAGIYCFT